MRKGQATSNTGRKKTSDVTHLLLKTGEDLVLGAWNQVESFEKENLSVGTTTTLVQGRKRIHGTIVSLGKRCFIPMSEKEEALTEQSA